MLMPHFFWSDLGAVSKACFSIQVLSSGLSAPAFLCPQHLILLLLCPQIYGG